MIALLLALSSAYAIDRETALDNAAQYSWHQWTMTSVNETADCSADYTSDYSSGTYRGLPYDWGGYYTLDEYDQAMTDGLGAGSHSWDGILDCTAGVDCSGFLSQVWEQGHFTTSTLYQITDEIAAKDLVRADAVNDAGSHVVMFAALTGDGEPVFYEASGGADKAHVNSSGGWSYLSGYQPVRLRTMEDGPTTSTKADPREIAAFPYEDFRWTAGAASDVIDSYSCAPSTDESGPEVLYHFSAKTKGTLTATVADDDGVDVDLHVMTAPNGESCVARDDSAVSLDVGPGDVWLSLDTYVGSHEFPGPYVLDVTFTGEVGAPDSGGGQDTGDTSSGGNGGDDTDVTPDDGGAGVGHGPGERVLQSEARGCDSAPGLPSPFLGALAGMMALGGARRRR